MKFQATFCSLHFLSNLNPIWEKRVWKLKFCSFCPDSLNQHCIMIIMYVSYSGVPHDEGRTVWNLFWPIFSQSKLSIKNLRDISK